MHALPVRRDKLINKPKYIMEYNKKSYNYVKQNAVIRLHPPSNEEMIKLGLQKYLDRDHEDKNKGSNVK